MSSTTRGISVAGDGEEELGGVSRAGERSGLSLSKQSRTTETRDNTAELGDDGGRGFYDGAITAASAMARGERRRGAGEKQRCLRGRGRRGRSIHSSRTARGRSRAAGSCVARGAVAVEHLPACLAEPSSSLERQLGWAGRWAGWGAR